MPSSTRRPAPSRAPARLAVVARTLRGLEGVAAAEIGERLAPRTLRRGHREVAFALDRHDPAVLELGTVDDVFLVIARGGPLPAGRRALRELRRLSRALEPTALALPAWVGRHPRGDLDVTASVRGPHAAGRVAFEDAVGEEVAARTGWRYRSRADGPIEPAAVSLRLHATPEATTLAVRVGARPLHRRPYRAATVPGALHPPLANALIRLAGLRAGERLVDPTCGGGTLVVEAALAVPGAEVAGFDLDRRALAVAHVAAARAGVAARLATADAAALPLAERSVDVVAANPPWGLAVGALGALAEGPGALAAEARRVLRSGGRLVAVEPADGPLAGALEAAGMRVRHRTWVRVAGRPAHVLVAAPVA